MEKVSILLKLSYKFTKKYIVKYIEALIKPIIFAISGILILALCLINPNISILGLISIPLFCYAFWKGFLITYKLIPCAQDFLKSTPLEFSEYLKDLKETEGKLAKFVCFMAIICLLLYIPGLIYVIKTIPLSFDLLYDSSSLLIYSKHINTVFLINTLFLAPFLNFSLCAYQYKKENEGFFKLFINCYKKLDIIGIIISLLFTLFGYEGGIIYIILALFLNPFIYSVNTFWYISRSEK